MTPTRSGLRRAAVRFEALGCTVHVGVEDADELATARALTEQVLRDVDEVASRFRPDSDLSRVNAHPGTWVEVDPLLVSAVSVACSAAADTDGLVHPLLGRPLVELGYDRDFASLVELPTGGVLETAAPSPTSWQQIDLDPAGALRIPAGTALDLGATGKAWCADLAATACREHLDHGAVISVGGDLTTVGGASWLVDVSEEPGGPCAQQVELRGGALATSSTRVRRWTRGGHHRHHLLDPRTGEPADVVWRTVSVAAPTCTGANTASTAAIVLGRDAVGWLATRTIPGLAARLVDTDGAVTTVGPWPAATDHGALR